MNIFNANNEKHLQILKEELRRAIDLIREYNEDETWSNMTDPERSQALLSVDDDLGPDLADEFVDTPWLKIPDVITNRIDLRRYMQDPSKISHTQHSRSLRRGIIHQMKHNESVAKLVNAYIDKQTLARDINDLTPQQIQYLMDKIIELHHRLSTFTEPTPEEQEQSSQAAYNYYKSMPGNWKGD